MTKLKIYKDADLLNTLQPYRVSPSIARIAKGLGVSAKSGVYERLQRLVKKGLVKKVNNKYYSLIKYRPPLEFVGEMGIDGKWHLKET